MFAGRPLIYLDVINETAPTPVAAPEDVQPLDAEHPIEIAFALAHKSGQLQLTFREEWDRDVWEQLPGYAGTDDIVDVFRRNLARGAVTCQKVIRKPGGNTRGVIYHGTVIVGIDDSETIQIGTMTLPKGVTLRFTHKTGS